MEFLKRQGYPNTKCNMEQMMTKDRATQIVLSLLKAHGIHKAVVSPGTTNIALVASMQYDSWFEVYSSIDERSAAYMACGMAMENNEPVILSCTEATASRNYYPALTEAFYRKLPILIITGTHGDRLTGHLHAQSLNRSLLPVDVVRKSISVNRIKDAEDEWVSIVDINMAILELKRHGGGPVHINLQEATNCGFTSTDLPKIRKIERVSYGDNFPKIEDFKRIVIFIGSHKPFKRREENIIDKFCEQHNAVVFCDHTSGFHGRYRVLNALSGCQHNRSRMKNPDLIIHLGEVSGEIYNTYRLFAKCTWRVNEDGEVRDLFRNLTYVFELRECDFFTHYISDSSVIRLDFFNYYKELYKELQKKIPELPFGNIWIAQHLHDKISKNAYLHLAIFNTLRSWNFFEVDDSIRTSCNVGGFGIDGTLSTTIGMSLANPQKIYYCIVGDLSFFYDMNSIGNRHIGNNIRILLINNGRGTEFRNYDHPASQWGDAADAYIAAGGHFACQSQTLVKNYAENLGFKYLSADSKEQYLSVAESFISPELGDRPILFEVFTNSLDESDAIRIIRNLVKDEKTFIKKVSGKVSAIAKRIGNI